MTSSSAPLAPQFRIFAVIFVILSALLIGLIVFFSMSKATITISPKKELLSVDFPVQVGPKADDATSQPVVKGVVVEKEVSYDEKVEASGTTTVSTSGKLTVKITNGGSATQPLIATTRVQAADGTLFRLKKAVTAPAKGFVDAEVYADKAGTSLPADAKFTIPGLNEAKQKIIYAESGAAAAADGDVVRTITEDDILKGKAAGLAKAEEDLKAALKKSHPEVTDVVVSREIVNTASNAKAGDAAQTATIMVKAKVTLVGYDGKAVRAMVQEKLISGVPEGKEFSGIHDNALVVRLTSADPVKGTAAIRVYADGDAVIKSTSNTLAKENVAGMSATQAKEFLENFDAIDEAEVKLFPSWLKKIPTLKDHIDIVVKK